ncbi:hypothetical protein [Pseudomonas sp. S11A4]|uniref:hypothetical protein n=1 Tax=Pseudomonas sp. S11A4 TaxID=1476791 RepID=UPI00215C4DED|nr:hypothetical protein [Pseudomonas sp. S11A4]MCR8935732.1 hypothetical protein [Pseudomonas sp. S11A4]
MFTGSGRQLDKIAKISCSASADHRRYHRLYRYQQVHGCYVFGDLARSLCGIVSVVNKGLFEFGKLRLNAAEVDHNTFSATSKQ